MEYFDKARELINVLEKSEGSNISKGAKIISESIMKGGILQAFGSGHSFAGAIEICGRAGGLIPTKIIKDKAEGMYEAVEGNAKYLMRQVDIRNNDVVVIISNSGRNPMSIEIAEIVKEKGSKLIVVTALDVSKNSTSRHSSGKLLYEFADVVLDNHSCFGDASLEVSGLDDKVCGTSSLANCLLLQQTIYEAITDMISKGYTPPVYKSANIDGGREFNNLLEQKYAERIWHR